MKKPISFLLFLTALPLAAQTSTNRPTGSASGEAKSQSDAGIQNAAAYLSNCGNDIGCAVTAAIAALPTSPLTGTNCGTVFIPASSTAYTLLTPMKIPECVTLNGQGAPATDLKWTGSGAGVYFGSPNTTKYAPYVEAVGGLGNLQIDCTGANGGIYTPGQVGLFIGDPNGKAIHARNPKFHDFGISGCDIDVEFGSNAFWVTFDNFFIQRAHTAAVEEDPKASNSGEAIRWINGTFAASQGPAFLNANYANYLTNVSIDFNGDGAGQIINSRITMNAGDAEWYKGPMVVNSPGSFAASGGTEFLIHPGGTAQFVFGVSGAYGALSLDNVNVFSGSPYTELINWTAPTTPGVSTLSIRNLSGNNNRRIPALFQSGFSPCFSGAQVDASHSYAFENGCADGKNAR